MDLSGRPERVVAGIWPGIWFSTIIAMRYWSSRVVCSWMWLGAPFFSSSRNDLLARTMSWSMRVMSSSARPSVEPLWTDGRTCGGGIGSTVSTIQSGRA
jgi:hypothetical protein